MALHHLPDDIDPKATEDGRPDNTRLEELVHELLGQIGEDPQRDGLVNTPRRVATAWRDLTSGYDMSVDELLNDALFDVAYDEMVIVKDIEIFSLCEHHLLPFFGKMHIAYIPRNKVIGLSKVARVADMFARRLQVQERLTHQVAETIQKAVDPIGVGVVCEARHLCMMMRGVEKQHSATITSSMLGDFRDNPKTREEFLSLVGRRSNGV
ncbi:MAG: GTP cyclohydrolase I FolE [Acidobacteria bacterium]|nr:GTP cyclohydrolase I FolE [Acidobacteriota bacterium]MDA1235510.1 GTP cyclohydrolase I FolE [Acidobacteriota bacterium]